MRPVTAAVFRQWVLGPAEGVFLFHPRALERLQREPGRSAVQSGVEICYHLLARRCFLERLETENPEALSVIEGLPLPEWILLLPMPGAPALKSTPERTLLRDYWARRFEGEVARAWQTARDDNQDAAHFGPAALASLIGCTAMAEARDVLMREGVAGAAEGETALCRSFAARVVRLRYCAPLTRGCCFPAVTDWAAVDHWFEESGLDLPVPCPGGRLPQALERGRPSADCGLPGVRLPLPADLPFGRCDPDRQIVERSGPTPRVAPDADGYGGTTASNALDADVSNGADSIDQPTAPALLPGPIPNPPGMPTHLQARCLDALGRGTAIRRRPPGLTRLVRALESVLLAPWKGRSPPPARGRPGDRWSRVRLVRLQSLSAAAQSAEWSGRFAAALGSLRAARACYVRIAGEPAPDDPVALLLEQRQRTAAESLADRIVVTWRLPAAAASDLRALLWRLATEHGTAAPLAQDLLGHLEIALQEEHHTYYRIEWRTWLSRGRARRILPFLSTLKGLAALDTASRLLTHLPWPVEDLDRFGAPLNQLTTQISERLERQLRPRLAGALETAGLVPSSARGRLAAGRLTAAMAELIRRRQHLKFTDVRDLLNQDALSLPDLRLAEIWEGDHLGHFDAAAAPALPGVYQPGAFYVKGLQRLSAPLFGSRKGRCLLRLVVLPGLAAWAAIEVTRLVWKLFTPFDLYPALTGTWPVLLLGAALSATVNTRRGRVAAVLTWRLATGLIRFLFITGLPRFLRWPPVVWFLTRRLVRTLLDRLLAPLALGLLPLLPVAALWSLAMPQAPGVTAWLPVLALAYAFGTLLRDTPAGRRRLDDLVTGWRRFLDLLRQERLAGLIAPVMEFFKQATRALTEGLHRIRTRLSPRLEERPGTSVLKALAALPWAFCEAVVEFYVVVLIEPQTNPIKHFPVVTLGHKLMLPFLPALSSGLFAATSPLLPDALAVSLVAVTVFLLPGLFGFLFWELKENWRLYGSNRGAVGTDPVPAARLGDHGETVAALVRRGFHGGGLPKAFDRLRQALDRQVREETPNPHELRRLLSRLDDYRALLARFAERELGGPLREACGGGLKAVIIEAPRIATQSVVFHARLLPANAALPVTLTLRLTPGEQDLVCALTGDGPMDTLSADCREQIAAAVRWFVRRCGVQAPKMCIGLNDIR
ncbi:hypothetical protein [Lamprocystis purpurea]|uniref:hypothetical protein n=1 Tax=Lamprocystis purpurea TaxID=61598 RepID=UPI00037334C9|nr:hypothetical protein [Lamprocystis purpurea]